MSDTTVPQLRSRIAQLGHSIAADLDALLAFDYPTASPTEFLGFLRRILDAVVGAASKASSPDSLRLLVAMLKVLASHIRFVDTSTYPCIPWALINPLEKLISRLLPDARFVFRAKWNWNYTILDISTFYRRALTGPGLSGFLDAQQIFPTNETWCIVSMPRVDRANILLHTILGHEAGHRVVDTFLGREDQKQLQQDIAQQVGDCKWRYPDIEKAPPAVQLHLKSQTFALIRDLRSHAIKELGSDLAGYFLFGPSFLFALSEALLDDSLDATPQAPGFYPPSRMRLRLVLAELVKSVFPRTLAGLTGSPLEKMIESSLDSRVNELQSIAAQDSDGKVIQADAIVQRAYQMVTAVLPAVRDFVHAEVGDLNYERKFNLASLQAVLGKLALGVPPSGAGAEFRDSLLAGCLYRNARLAVPQTRAASADLSDAGTLSRLVHKAVEYCDLQEEYDGRNA